MSCYSIPIHTDPETTCSNYTCGEECITNKFVYAKHYFKNGYFNRTSVSGAYVPAVTVCQLGITTTSIGKVRYYPDAPYIGLPHA
jgi:hypothetical protein